jgi:hypothetical protein
MFITSKVIALRPRELKGDYKQTPNKLEVNSMISMPQPFSRAVPRFDLIAARGRGS